MNISKWFLAALIFLFSDMQLVSAAATCTLNGEVIPCDQMPDWFWPIVIGFSVFGIFAFIFWLWMLIDAIRYQKESKTMWVLLIVFLNFLGALLYYFFGKRARTKG